MNEDEKDEFIELVAQAVIDRIEQREQLNRIADLIVERVLAAQRDGSEQEVHTMTSDKTHGNTRESPRPAGMPIRGK